MNVSELDEALRSAGDFSSIDKLLADVAETRRKIREQLVAERDALVDVQQTFGHRQPECGCPDVCARIHEINNILKEMDRGRPT